MTFTKSFILYLAMLWSLESICQKSASTDITEANKIDRVDQTDPHVMSRTIPYQLAHNLMIVRAYINGIAGNFIVDTGAEVMILNEKFFTGKKNRANHAVDFNGSQVRYKETQVLFSWDKTHEKPISAIVMDMSQIEKIIGGPIWGNIGYNVLKDYETTIDNAKRKLYLLDLDPEGNRLDNSQLNENLIDIVKLHPNGCKPYIIADTRDRNLKLGIDTGAAWTVLSKGAIKKVKDQFQRNPNIKSSNYKGKIYKSQNGILRNISINNTIWNSVKIVIAQNWNSGNTSRKKLEGLLGNEFIHQRKVGINFIKGELYLYETDIKSIYDIASAEMDEH